MIHIIIDFIICAMHSTVRSLGFLTRLPIRKKWFKNENKISSDALAFPFAGCIIGLIASPILFITKILFSPLVAAFFTVITLVFITGALHEDGLGDVADAFWALKNPQDRLRIMKDSQIGVFGGLSLIFTIGLRIVLLADIVAISDFLVAFSILIAVEAASRGTMVCFWYLLPLAKRDSLIATVGKPNKQTTIYAAIISFAIFSILIIPVKGFLAFVAATCFVIFSLYGFIKICHKKIGGYTGDAIGAMQQISTVVLLTCLDICF